MTTSVRTRIVEPIDPADFLQTSQAIQVELDSMTAQPITPPAPANAPRSFPTWAIALAAAGLGVGLGAAVVLAWVLG